MSNQSEFCFEAIDLSKCAPEELACIVKPKKLRLINDCTGIDKGLEGIQDLSVLEELAIETHWHCCNDDDDIDALSFQVNRMLAGVDPAIFTELYIDLGRDSHLEVFANSLCRLHGLKRLHLSSDIKISVDPDESCEFLELLQDAGLAFYQDWVDQEEECDYVDLDGEQVLNLLKFLRGEDYESGERIDIL